jgi:hypothetical protein
MTIRRWLMVSIKKAPKKESSAPIITVPMARVRLNRPEFHPDPRDVESKDGSRTFAIDPGLNAQVEIVDDHGDGSYDGVKFYQNFKLKWNEDGEFWEFRDGTSLAALMKACYGDIDFDSDEDFDFHVEDFDEFEFMCKVVPKKNPSTGQEIGSMCHYETIWAGPNPKKKKKLSTAQQAAREATNAEIDELPGEDEAE